MLVGIQNNIVVTSDTYIFFALGQREPQLWDLHRCRHRLHRHRLHRRCLHRRCHGHHPHLCSPPNH
jgi:hypothetical protein